MSKKFLSKWHKKSERERERERGKLQLPLHVSQTCSLLSFSQLSSLFLPFLLEKRSSFSSFSIFLSLHLFLSSLYHPPFIWPDKKKKDGKTHQIATGWWTGETVPRLLSLSLTLYILSFSGKEEGRKKKEEERRRKNEENEGESDNFVTICDFTFTGGGRFFCYHSLSPSLSNRREKLKVKEREREKARIKTWKKWEKINNSP